jgi:hypothetical protein
MFSAAYESSSPGEINSKPTMEWIRPLGVAPVAALPKHLQEMIIQKKTDFLL